MNIHLRNVLIHHVNRLHESCNIYVLNYTKKLDECVIALNNAITLVFYIFVLTINMKFMLHLSTFCGG
jgi:hypothetical protein